MGRLVNHEQIISSNIKKRIIDSKDNYTKFLDTTPVFVTYYRYDPTNSTSDIGLNSVENHYGDYSPKKYHKIENFPIYGMEAIEGNITFNEGSFEVEAEQTAVVLPGTIEPRPNDLFLINDYTTPRLFRVTNFALDFIKDSGERFYRISYEFFRIIDMEEIDKDISETFVFLFNNIGTLNKPIIKKEDYIKLSDLEKIFYELRNKYCKFFFKPDLNYFVIKDTDNNFQYSDEISYFFIRNELLKIDAEFMNTIYIFDKFSTDLLFVQRYENTIFSKIENKESIETLFQGCTVMNHDDDELSVFRTRGLTALNIFSINSNLPEYNNYWPDQLFNRIKINSLYPDDSPNFIYNLIIKYFNVEEDDKFTVSQEEIVLLNKFNPSYNFNNFMTIPLILFVIKKCLIDIMKDKLKV